MLRRIEYKPLSNGGAEISVDGQKLTGVVGFHLDHCVAEVPEVVLEMHPMIVSAEQLADLKLSISSESLTAAIECIKLYAALDDDFVDSVGDLLADIVHDKRLEDMGEVEMSRSIARTLLTELSEAYLGDR